MKIKMLILMTYVSVSPVYKGFPSPVYNSGIDIFNNSGVDIQPTFERLFPTPQQVLDAGI